MVMTATVTGSIPGALVGAAIGLLAFRFGQPLGARWWKETDRSFMRDVTPQRVEWYVWASGAFGLAFAVLCVAGAVWLIAMAMT